MKILHVITTLDIGGAERLMVDLLPRINKENIVDLLLFNGMETPFKNELIKNGVNIYHLSCWQGIKHHLEVYNPINIIRLRKFIGQYDIIHTHNTACQFYVPLALKKCKSSVMLVTTEHSTSNRRRSMRWFHLIDKWMYRRYNAIVCISGKTSENLMKHIGITDKIRTIYNGVNVDRFIKPITDISTHSIFVVSMIAAIRKEKDHETLLRAMSHLPINYKLQLAGQDFDNRIPALKKLCKELGIEKRVDFMGARSDVPEILANSDVVVLSSHWEGFGLAAVEAMASGRPLIASDVGGLRDVVDGAGVLFPHGDDKVLAEKIQYLCEHPDEYCEVAKRCQEKAKQYDISVMAENYLDLYKKLYEDSQMKN